MLLRLAEFQQQRTSPRARASPASQPAPFPVSDSFPQPSPGPFFPGRLSPRLATTRSRTRSASSPSSPCRTRSSPRLRRRRRSRLPSTPGAVEVRDLCIPSLSSHLARKTLRTAYCAVQAVAPLCPCATPWFDAWLCFPQSTRATGGLETPAGAMTDLTAVGEGRGTVLGLKLDRLSGAPCPAAPLAPRRLPRSPSFPDLSILTRRRLSLPPRFPSPVQTPCPARPRWTPRATSRTSSP